VIAAPANLEWLCRDTRSRIASYLWENAMKLRNVSASTLFASLLAVGVTFGGAAMAQGNHQQYGGGQGGGQQGQWGQQGQQDGYYGSSYGSYGPRQPGWRWQQRCWIERIPGSGLGPQRVCR
jgi:hypothetical protein